jgi:hypothetical protein
MDPTVIVGYTTDSNVVGYSKNDFIYSSMDKDNVICPKIPTQSDCSTITDANVNGCVAQAYCENKKYAEDILARQEVHTGADIRFLDTKQNYNMKLMTTINLGVGIIGIGLFIFYNH